MTNNWGVQVSHHLDDCRRSNHQRNLTYLHWVLLSYCNTTWSMSFSLWEVAANRKEWRQFQYSICTWKGEKCLSQFKSVLQALIWCWENWKVFERVRLISGQKCDKPYLPSILASLKLNCQIKCTSHTNI